MKKTLIGLTVAAALFGAFTLTAYAASLTQAQINAILMLLRSFGADERVVANVAVSLGDTSYSPTPSPSYSGVILNPGFETDYGVSAGWTADAFQAGCQFSFDTTVFHSGSRSAKIYCPSLNDARWIQEVVVEKNTDYIFSGWVKSENVANSPQEVNAGANLSRWWTYTKSPGLLGTNNWTYQQVHFNSGEDTKITLALRLGYWYGITTGTAWFDDIKFERADGRPMPTPLPLLTPTPTPMPTPTQTLIPTPTSTPLPTPTPTPAPTPSKTSTANPDYDINVLVAAYFPYSGNGAVIGDPSLDKAALRPLSVIRKSSADQVRMMKEAIEESSRYLGYKNPDAELALRYHVDSREYFSSPPYRRHFDGFLLDYPKILKTHNICALVEQKNVSEVWIMIPSHIAGYDHKEFMLVGPHETFYPDWDDFSGELPMCSKTYKVVTHGYDGEYYMAEVWGHMLEYELRRADEGFFYLFQGPCYGSDDYTCHPLGNAQRPIIGRCGNMHNPPNASGEYDRANQTLNSSDCRDWNPDNLGALSQVSCKDWGCSYNSIFDNPVRNWSVWNWQNMPGRNNKKTYKGRQLRNWWDAHGNYDGVIGRGEGLLLGGPQVPLPNISFGSRNEIAGGTIYVDMCSKEGVLMPESVQVGITLGGAYRQFVVRRFDILKEGCIRNSYDVSRWGVSHAPSATISLDPKNIIRESNESDNQITIRSAVATPTPMPTPTPTPTPTPMPTPTPNTPIPTGVPQLTTLPVPILVFESTEDYTANGQQWTRYKLGVSNWSSYADELFAAASSLPPCGLNNNSARTWVNIYNAATDAYIYGFCALGTARALDDIWFAVGRGQNPPAGVYITLNDRERGLTVRSNEADIPWSVTPTPTPSSGPLFAITSVALNSTTLTINGASVNYTIAFKNNDIATTSIAVQAWIEQGSTKRAAGGALVWCGGAIGTVGAHSSCSSKSSTFAKDQSPIAGSGNFSAGPATAIFQIKNSSKVLAEKTVPVTLISSTSVPPPASPTASAIESLRSSLIYLQMLLSDLKNQQ